MSRTRAFISFICMAWGMMLLANTTCAPAAERPDPAETTRQAQQILDACGVQGGLLVHLGCGDGRLTAALQAGGNYLVHGLETDADNVRLARETIHSLGRYGRLSVDHFDGKHLPYIDNLVNLVVVEDLGDVSQAELLRVLAPEGVAYVRQDGGDWAKTVKPRPAEIDEWTHWLHGADGNAVADDLVVGPPRHAQWIAPPRWQRHHEATPSVSAMVSAGGRLFAIINEAPPGIDGMPDDWALVARDAFNGTLLWKRRIAEWGWSQWSDHSYGNGRWNLPTHLPRRLVAVGDRVYVTLGFNSPLTALDAATGRTLITYPNSQFTDEILYHDGTLVLAVNEAEQGPGRLDEKPPVKKSIVALNAKSGELLWSTADFVGIASKADAIERVTHLSMALGGGKVFCIEEDAVLALDIETGKRVWRVDRPPRDRPVTYGSYYFTNLCSLVYHDGMLLFSEPDATLKRQPWNAPAGTKLLGIAADTGEVFWTRECGVWGHYNQGDIFFIDGLAWVHKAWVGEAPKRNAPVNGDQSFSLLGLDPRTGEVQRTIATHEALDQGHHHRCYRNKATVRYLVTGRRGVEFIDLRSGDNRRHHWTRGTCRYGVMPCNGLLYLPPHPCVCYITAKLNGFWALAGERKSKVGESKGRRSKVEEGKDDEGEGGRLVRGPAYGDGTGLGDAVGGPPAADWPTHRHDAARSGCASTVVSSQLRPAWKTPVGGRLSSSVIADARVFLASTDAHTVWAIDAEDGKPLWSYTAGGRIDTPPTAHGQTVLFGSADGWATCLRAADGELVWRRRAAPEELRLVNDDQLESPWPVHGSVLIQDGVAYLAAGRSSFLDGGIHVLAIDAATGALVQRQCIYSPESDSADMVECRLPYDMPPDALGALPDVLVGDGSHVYMRHLRFNPVDLEYGSATEPEVAKQNRRSHQNVGGHLMSVAGLLDDNWFNQTYWTVDGRSHSKLLVFDDGAAYGVKPFPGNARHSRAIFTPGSKGYTLFSNQRPGHQPRWSIQVPVRIRAMLVAGSTLFVAGTPDVVNPDDPWAAIEGRAGGVLWAVSTTDGEKLSEVKLDKPPIFDGMAAADGRLYVSTTDGNLVCFDGR